MKLDTKSLRYLTNEDWAILKGVERGSKNHEVVPTPLIIRLSGLRTGSGVHKSISTLAKIGLIAKVKNTNYDGYRLTYGGLDYLSLHDHLKRDAVYSVGNQIGVGKESDIYVVASPKGTQLVLKIHRLGRISFRTVKTNRDYLRNRTAASWMYMSCLAADKEFAFMTALRENGFPVPKPVARSRHTLVMELIDAFPLRQITEVPDPAGLYAELIALIIRLAEVGLIHGDFNEFNILIKEETVPPSQPISGQPESTIPASAPSTAASSIRLVPILIDFPQMVSVSHKDAAMYFDRDVECVKRFFERRFGFVSDEPGPFFADALVSANAPEVQDQGEGAEDGEPTVAVRTTKGGKKGSSKFSARKNRPQIATRRLDIQVEASGFSRQKAKELEKYMKAFGVDGDRNGDERGDDEELEADSERESDPQSIGGDDEKGVEETGDTLEDGMNSRDALDAQEENSLVEVSAVGSIPQIAKLEIGANS
ncbi:MAG: hypothetical protein M4579_005666 [Chaenotheca gracillima]|nr:MAG: hypothetical protein M4579_005666 [Chaenotheca gracillima]